MDMWDTLIICPILLDNYRIGGRKGKGIPDPMIDSPASGIGLEVSKSTVLKKPCLNNFLWSPGWVGANEARRTPMNEDTREGCRERRPKGGEDRFSRNERAVW